MKKSYIVFAVFTTFTQAVFSVLLFLEKFGILHFCDFSPDQGVFGIKIFKSS